jgi:hypothetical protein
MIRKLFKKLKLNKQAGFSEFISSMLSILAIATLVIILIQFIGDISTRIQADQVARKYMLRVESTGTLTPADAKSLKSEINSITNLTFNKVELNGTEITVGDGTTGDSVGYGNSAELVITCTIKKTNYITTSGVFGINWSRKDSQMTIVKQSTAKY